MRKEIVLTNVSLSLRRTPRPLPPVLTNEFIVNSLKNNEASEVNRAVTSTPRYNEPVFSNKQVLFNRFALYIYVSNNDETPTLLRHFFLSLFPFVSSSVLDSGLGNTGRSPGSRTLEGSFYRRAHRSEGSSSRRSDVFSTLSEDDMEEELEKTKVVKAFWDLRQEVRICVILNLRVYSAW